ncbi:MAG: hypothetical protein U5K79_11915 [Cyclobacteriaceae bacterium]|nr:hypothetical protein [Cyclobacteriaceae bacterium]
MSIDSDGISTATNSHGNLTIIPAGKTKWLVSQVRGLETPEVQGWYSEVYNQFVPKYRQHLFNRNQNRQDIYLAHCTFHDCRFR